MRVGPVGDRGSVPVDDKTSLLATQADSGVAQPDSCQIKLYAVSGVKATGGLALGIFRSDEVLS
jgi:hypothetical protein